MPGVHVLLRSCPGENRKDRPAWYSKDLALASLLTAVAHARATGPVDLTFANDGELPPHRLDAMAAAGRVVPIAGGSNRRSLRATVALARRQGWPAADLVVLLEDDYLLRPDALTTLREAAVALPAAGWFALHGTSAFGDPVGASTIPEARRAARDLAADASVVGGVTWVPVVSTTSSLATRAGTLRQDAAILRWVPFAGGAFDEATCLVLAGRPPFGWATVLRGRNLVAGHDDGDSAVRLVVRAAARAAVNLRAHRRAAHRRRLVGPRPPLAVHLERDALGDDEPRWAQVAAGTPALVDASAGHR